MIVEGADGFAAPFFQNGKRKRQSADTTDFLAIRKRSVEIIGDAVSAAALAFLAWSGAKKRKRT